MPRRPQLTLAIAALALALAASLPACASPDDHRRAAMTSECTTCHAREYLTASPDHVGAKPSACSVCHMQSAWSPSVRNHTWALTGKHAALECASCHTGSTVAAPGTLPPMIHATAKLCFDCHRADFARATFPEHETFPTTCEECHTTAAWKPSTWVDDAGAPFEWDAAVEPPRAPAPDAPDAGGAPNAKPKPKPRPAPVHPKPAPTPTPPPSAGPPDVVSHPSRRPRPAPPPSAAPPH